MKPIIKPPVLTAISATAGLACLCVRQWLLSTGTDEKGLLILSQPGNLLSWVLLALVAVVLPLSYPGKCRYRFPAMPLRAVSDLCSAIGYAAAAWIFLTSNTLPVARVAGVTAIISVLCACLMAVGSFRRFRVNPVAYCPGVVFFMLLLICRYQTWSAEPELQRYFFQLAASAGLLLTTFQRAAMVGGIGKGSSYLLISRATLFLCIAAIPGSDLALIHGALALNILLDGCTVLPRQQEGEAAP